MQGIGTGNPGYFATSEKSYTVKEGTFSGYAGIGFRANEDHAHALGGIKFSPTASPWTFGLQNEGHRSHPFVSYNRGELTYGLYLIEMKSLGIMFSFAR